MRAKIASVPERIERKKLNQMEYEKQLALQEEFAEKENNTSLINLE